MPEGILYKSSSLIIYSSGLSESLKRGLPVSPLANEEQTSDTESITHKRQRVQTPVSNKEKCHAYRNRRRQTLAKDPAAEFAEWYVS